MLDVSLLERYGAATRAELGHYLDRDHSEVFLDPLIAEYPMRGGKMLRPAICIANARVFGGSLESALGCAVAIELLHNALLIHDDIQDGSELRRGQPTLHTMHGVPLAINAGDAMLFTSFLPLLDALRPFGPEVGRQVLHTTVTMARNTAEGQALELGWRDRNVTALDESDYMRMALKKTAWMGMIWPAQLGVIIGSQGRANPERVIRFGMFLGLAFQIEDDLRNLSDDPGYGKERNGDLAEAKRTLMLIHLLGAATPKQRERIDAMLACERDGRSEEDILWMAELMVECGSIAYARGVASAMAAAAAQECALAYAGLPPSEDLAFLQGLSSWVADRP